MTYAGDVSSQEAHEALQADPNAVLVDCRTIAEWQFVGVPAVDRVVFSQWSYPDGSENAEFLGELAAAGVRPDQTVYFLCRSGQRSRAAAQAATAAGFDAAYNVADGFEGPLDPQGARTISGWKTNGLPWSHSR